MQTNLPADARPVLLRRTLTSSFNIREAHLEADIWRGKQCSGTCRNINRGFQGECFQALLGRAFPALLPAPDRLHPLQEPTRRERGPAAGSKPRQLCYSATAAGNSLAEESQRPKLIPTSANRLWVGALPKSYNICFSFHTQKYSSHGELRLLQVES